MVGIMNQPTQQLLPTFSPSEADLVQMALAQPLDRKIERSIGLLRMYGKDGVIVAFSGGKDSCVIKQLAKEAGIPFKAVYNNTTIDPPELIYFIREHHADVGWRNPKLPLLKRMVKRSNGPPTRLARWCCAEYKERDDGPCKKVIGVRISESARRARLWKEFVPNRNDGILVAPICYWTDEDVWAFIRDRKLTYCSLYDEGFKRLGCVGCPLAGPNCQRMGFERWPGYERAWKRHVELFFLKWKGVPLDNPYWEKLSDGEPYDSLATQFGTDTVQTEKEAKKLKCVVGTVVRTQFHWWRWFEKFDRWEDMWNWWVSGKASEGDASCAYEEMMMNV